MINQDLRMSGWVGEIQGSIIKCAFYFFNVPKNIYKKHVQLLNHTLDKDEFVDGK